MKICLKNHFLEKVLFLFLIFQWIMEILIDLKVEVNVNDIQWKKSFFLQIYCNTFICFCLYSLCNLNLYFLKYYLIVFLIFLTLSLVFGILSNTQKLNWNRNGKTKLELEKKLRNNTKDTIYLNLKIKNESKSKGYINI